MNKVSFSQFGMWATCPWQWKLNYVDGHRVYDQSIHTAFGSSMHEIIQEWLDVLYNQSETKAKTIYLHDIFKENFLGHFKEGTIIAENGEKTFLCDKPTLMEFYEQGCQILTYIQNNYKKIFPTKNVKLFAIEYELDIQVRSGVKYIGFIDVVTYDEAEDKYTLYDLKTSRSGWSSYQKKDPKKINQLLLYKKLFAEQMGIDLKAIDVEFTILKRFVSENADFPIPRVSKFVPAHGKPSINKSWEYFEEFLNTCFDGEGNYIAEQKATPSSSNCRFCNFKDNKELCSYGV
jgi:hypothetical protein